jgi:flagellar protein FlgJ
MDIPQYHSAIQTIASPKPAGKQKTARDLKALRESCREFEAIFIQQMYQAMRKNVPDDGLFPQDNATSIYQDMLDVEIAKETAKGQGIGLGESMYNQLKVTIEKKAK